MNYEQAWNELNNLISTVKGLNLECDELDTLFICIEHIQSQLNNELEVDV